MGAILSIGITTVTTFLGSFTASCCSNAICKAKCNLNSNFLYMTLLFIFTIFGSITKYRQGDIVVGNKDFPTYDTNSTDCTQKYRFGWVICCNAICSGNYSVYRFSFSLFIFSLTMLCLTIKKSTVSYKVHNNFWCIKVLYIFAILSSTLFIPNNVLDYYQSFSRYTSLLFLVYQLVLFIDYSYSVNESYMKYENGRKIVLSVSLLLYVISFISWIYMGNTFASGECNFQKALITVTIIIPIFSSILACTEYAPHGTIITSSVLTFYCTYLCYSYLSVMPSNNCNPFMINQINVKSIILSSIFTSLSLLYFVWSHAFSQKISETLMDTVEEKPKESFLKFHTMMCLVSLYMAMLVTDWETGTNTAVNWQNFYIKLSSQIICTSLYLWSLMAPYILRDYRDFGVEF